MRALHNVKYSTETSADEDDDAYSDDYTEDELYEGLDMGEDE